MSVYSVDAGETAILTRYGEIVDTKTSGLNWKSPVENVTFFSTREAQIRAEAEAKIRITQAESEAKQRTLQADAEAHAIKVKGQAEADSAKALAEALAKNQELVALKTAEKWNGVLPTYIPQGTVMPFVQLPQK